MPEITKPGEDRPGSTYVVTYHPNLPSLGHTTKKRHKILHTSDRLRQAFPAPPIIAYRRPKNICDLLLCAEIKPATQSGTLGNHPCGQSRCKTCPILLSMAEFASKSTGRKNQLKVAATCKTSNVVYLIQCKKCGQQYVSETGQALHCRMNNY